MTTTHRHKSKPECPRETAVTPIASTGLLLTVIENGTGIGTGIGTGTVIVIEELTHLVAAGGTTDPTHTTNADIPLPHAAISEIQINTDLLVTAKAHASENAPRDTETTNTVKDLPLTDIDRPAGSTTAMTTKIRKSARDADVRDGNATRIRIARGGNTTIRERNHRSPTTRKKAMEVTVEETTMTPQVYTKASTGLGMIQTRCPFRITL